MADKITVPKPAPLPTHPDGHLEELNKRPLVDENYNPNEPISDSNLPTPAPTSMPIAQPTEE